MRHNKIHVSALSIPLDRKLQLPIFFNDYKLD